MTDSTIAFIGLGLIGGSIARGIKRANPDTTIMAYMRTRSKLEQAKADGIRHNAKGPILILTSNHPSPLSALRGPAPFIGCGHFRKANEWLQSQGAEPVRWLEFAAGAESAQGFRLT